MGKNKLLIYSYSGSYSKLDNYVVYLLDNIQVYISEIIIVVNSNITDEIEKKFKKYSDKVYIQENISNSVSAYKAGLEYYGWDNIKKFNEIIFMNDSVYGPVTDFKDLFDTMDNKNISFWEIVENSSPKENDTISLLNEYIDMYFMAVRKDMFLHNEFKSFFYDIDNNYINIRNKFIDEFINLGFKYDTYINDETFKNYVPNIIIHAPQMLIEKYNCPVFLKDIFMIDYKNWTVYSDGNEIIDLLKYLNEKTSYNTDMVYDSIIKQVNQYDFKYFMHHNYILSEERIEKQIKHKFKTALMMHLYYEDLFEEMLEYAKNMPEYADIFISTQTEEKKKLLEELTKNFPNKVKIIVIKNRGRDVASLTVAFREYIYNYDIVCFAHDKKVSQADYSIKGKTYEKHCFGNIMPSKEYVSNVINKFAEDDKIGILAPPVPMFGEYYPAVSGYGCGWGINYHLCKDLAERLNITLHLDENKAPTAPYGSIFWFRVDALKPLFDLNLTYEDFPEEPVPCDGTISHAIERIHPYIAQSKGYYAATIISDKNMPVYLSNLHYMLTEVNKQVYKFFPSSYFVRELYDIEKLKEKMDYMGNEIVKLSEEIVKEENKNKDLIIKYNELNDSNNELKDKHDKLNEEYNELNNKYVAETTFLNNQYNNIINSKSWKITKPLRYIMQLVKSRVKKK